jgi:hypothetical protein
LKPRVYYARGPDQYYSSRVIQSIFNTILENLPNVSKFGRHNPQTMPHNPDDTVFIYDYAAFTSTLHEIRNFTSKLADFYLGTIVEVVDTFEGIVMRDLGELLHAFNQDCNLSPEFDASELLAMEDLILTHNCGMLGVPGNISSCTLLHGIHLAVIVGSLHRNKVVGDDAIGRFVPEQMEEEDLHSALGNLGVVARTKMEFWRSGTLMTDEDQTWNYVKRPVTVIEGRLDVGALVIWPDIANVFLFKDPYHTARDLPEHRRVLKYCNQVTRFLQDVELLTPSSMDIQVIERSLQVFHRRLGFTRLGGYVGPLNRKEISNPIVPSSAWSGCVIAHLMEKMSGQIVTLPEFWDPTQTVLPELVKGQTFRWKGDRMLKLICDLGYGDREERKVSFVGGDHPARLQTFFSKTYVRTYDYIIYDSVPVWMFQDILQRLTLVPEEPDFIPISSLWSDVELDTLASSSD